MREKSLDTVYDSVLLLFLPLLFLLFRLLPSRWQFILHCLLTVSCFPLELIIIVRFGYSGGLIDIVIRNRCSHLPHTRYDIYLFARCGLFGLDVIEFPASCVVSEGGEYIGHVVVQRIEYQIAVRFV